MENSNGGNTNVGSIGNSIKNERSSIEETIKSPRKKINFTIDSDVLEIIREEAEQDDRSLSQYINIILKEHIKAKEK